MSIEDKNRRAVSDEELEQVTGGKKGLENFGLCIPKEGMGATVEGGTFNIYTCSDPGNKGKKSACSGCPAN